MTDYVAYEYPLPEFYQQELSGSLDDGLERWGGYQLLDLTESMRPLIVDLTRSPALGPTHNHESYVFPDWGSFLFGRIVVIPSRLDLGNLVSSQSRTLEIANLYLHDVEWLNVSTDIEGLVFVNPPAGLVDSPTTPHSILSFGSYLLQVTVTNEGDPVIDGDILLDFDVSDVVVPVTGTRVVVFHYEPRPGIEETLMWKTDVLEAHDGTEQRIGLRRAPRQSMRMQYILDHDQDRFVRGLLFDWLPRVFAVPVWWEARNPSMPLLPGDLTIQVSTLYGDFRVGELVMIHLTNDVYEMIGIESFDATSITLRSEISRAYGTSVKIMPVRSAYSTSVPTMSRVPRQFTEYNMEFVVIENEPLPDSTGQPTYDGKLYLSECNLIEAGDSDQYSRPVVVLDNDTGRVYQTSRTDRSRFSTKKVWDVPNLAELWRVRRLLHAIDGSRTSFFIPTFRDDLTLSDTIGIGSTTVRIVASGYAAFIASRRPFADLRLTKTDGTTYTRRVIDAEADGDEEVLTLDDSFDPSNSINVADVARIEFVTLVRISDDKAQFIHRHLGDANVTINLITVKE